MPRDTPPPIPRQRPRSSVGGQGSNANMVPLGDGRGHLQDQQSAVPDLSLPPKPVATVQKVYESAPQVRDLRKEATQKFMPTVVKRKIDASKGRGRLLEEDEVEKLEQEGYGSAKGKVETVGAGGVMVDAAPAVDERSPGSPGAGYLEEEQARILKEEEERFAREMAMTVGDDGEDDDQVRAADRGKGVTMEEISDDDI